MYALTIRQPWAWAICRAGKDIENRTRPDRRIPGQIVAIHAGQAQDWSGLVAIARARRASGQRSQTRIVFAEAPTGAIVAVARFGEPVRESASPWFTGPIGWPLSEVRVLATPIPCRGQRGFWAVPAEIETAIAAQLPPEVPHD